MRSMQIFVQCIDDRHIFILDIEVKDVSIAAIRSGLMDFGMTEIPFCIAQRSPICAGVLAYLVPRTHITSLSKYAPLARGA